MAKKFDTDIDLEGVARILNSLDPVNPQDLTTRSWVINTAVELYFSTFALFPITGDATKIYIATDTNLVYRWNGTAYVAIGGTATAAGAKGDIQFRGNTVGSFAAASNSFLNWDDNKISLQVGTTPSASVADALITQAKSVNGYVQSILQNTNPGPQASTDFVAMNNLGADSSYYIDIGINSSNYNDPSYPLSLANDGYLYTEDANLTIGTDTAGKYLLFHTGGFGLTNERMRIIDAAAAKDAQIKLSSHLLLLADTTANRPTTPINGTLRYNSSNNKFEGYENATWKNLISEIYTHRVTVAQTANNTNWQNITQLTSVSLPVGNYRIMGVIKFQSAATTTGIGLRFNVGTATVSDILAQWSIPTGADGAANNTYDATQRTTGDIILGTSVGAANTNYAAVVEGFFTVSVAGTVLLQMRSEVGGSVVTVGVGSFIKIEALP
jgi:hypothetical protein